MNRPSHPTIKDIEAMLKEEGQRKRDMGERMLASLGPCGAAHGDYPGICGRVGTALWQSDGITCVLVYRCPEHS